MPETIDFTNFSPGIVASPGFIPRAGRVAASDIRNFTVDAEGRLIKRAGRTHLGEAFANQVIRIIPCYYSDGDTVITHLFAVSTDSIWYWDDSARQQLTLPDFDFDEDGSTDSYAVTQVRGVSWAVGGGRLFIVNGRQPLWIDLSQNPAAGAPTAYYWGINPTTFNTYSPNTMPLLERGVNLTTVAGGSLTDTKWYGVAFTYYNDTFGIESQPSERDIDLATPRGVIQVNAPDLTIRASSLTDNTDPQVTRKRIWLTDPQDTEEAAETADLKLYTDILDNVTTTDITGGFVLGITNSTATYGNPPSDLQHIVHHAGRLWGNPHNTSTIQFIALSSEGAPLWDAWPSNQKFYINKDDGDVITRMLPSPTGQTLYAFKQNSVGYIKGSGLITGLYTPNVGIDLDASHIAQNAGGIAMLSPAVIPNQGAIFLARDKQLYVTGAKDPVSLPVQPILDDIHPGREDEAVGWVAENKYYLAFAATGSDFNNRVLCYDFTRKYWTMFDGWPIADAAWATGGSHKGKQFAALDNGNFVDELFEGSDDAGSSFTPSWTSNWFSLPVNSVITGVYVVMTTPASISVRVDADGSNGGTKTFTPARAVMRRQGFFVSVESRGRVHLSGVNLDLVERITVEYEVR